MAKIVKHIWPFFLYLTFSSKHHKQYDSGILYLPGYSTWGAVSIVQVVRDTEIKIGYPAVDKMEGLSMGAAVNLGFD